MRVSSQGVLAVALLAAAAALPPGAAAEAAASSARYMILATNKTSSMEKEMNDAASKGFRFAGVMGGETSFGGSEVVVVMESGGSRAPESGSFDYKLLATSKTSTMQKELQAAGDAGFEYKGQSVFKTTFGGSEVVVILERNRARKNPARHEYLLLATKKTSTMDKELAGATAEGYEFVGLTVAETLMGGSEIVTIMRRPVTR
jgi:hypothetical protein